MESQPPPDAPAPPPGPEALRSRSKLQAICATGGLSILGLVLLFAGSPLILRSKKAVERTEALNNVRQIGLALFEFEADYGRFPDASTIPEVQRRTSTPLALGTASSNQLFRQLLATVLKSEKPFYAKIPGAKRPDNVFHSDATALAKGECGFSYVAGLRSSDDPQLPVAMTPMIPGTRRFSTATVLNEKAVVLRLDQSAKAETINNRGHAMVGGGRNLFDPALWGGITPDLKWPE